MGTVAAVTAYLKGGRTLALGIMFVLATVSRLTVPIAGSGMRLEQAAVVLIVATILLREREELAGLLRRAWIPFTFAGVYLAAHVASSAAIAAEPLESLKIAAWLGISMAAGAIAAVVAYRAGPTSLEALVPWVVGAAVLHAGLAILAVASQVVLDTTWGVQSTDVLIGKAFGLSHEANLLGILVAAALLVLLVDSPRAHLRGFRTYAVIAWLALGLGLAYSRGPLIGFAVAVGAAVLLVAVGRRFEIRSPRARPGLAIMASGGLVLIIAVGAIQLQDTFARMGARDPDNIIVVGDVPAPSGHRRTPAPSATARPSAKPSTPPAYVGTSDTVAVRMRNITIAMSEFPTSPVIGLGTDSYGQRHTEPGCDCPAHISNLTIATLYEAGVVGIVGLSGLLAGTAFAVWRLRAWGFGAAILSVLIGFQVTDAFRFAWIWILLGTVVGAWASGGALRRQVPREQRLPPDGGSAPERTIR